MADETRDPREPYGRLVHDTRLTYEADRAAAEGRATFRLGTWEDRTERQHELDMRIGSAVAAQAVKDAGLANERMQRMVFALDAHRPAVFEALRFAIASVAYASEAKRYRAALKALGGDEEGEGRV